MGQMTGKSQKAHPSSDPVQLGWLYNPNLWQAVTVRCEQDHMGGSLDIGLLEITQRQLLNVYGSDPA